MESCKVARQAHQGPLGHITDRVDDQNGRDSDWNLIDRPARSVSAAVSGRHTIELLSRTSLMARCRIETASNLQHDIPAPR